MTSFLQLKFLFIFFINHHLVFTLIAVLLVVAIAAVVVSGDGNADIADIFQKIEGGNHLPDSVKHLIDANPNLKKDLDEVRLKALEALKANNAKLAGGKANRGDGGGPKLGVSIEDFGIVSGIIKETSNLVDSAKILADSIDRAISG